MNLLKALATVSGMTMLSRILGFVRDAIIARVFGAGMATDAFFVAFRLPNLLRRMFAEGAFSQAFVPILGEYRNKRGEADTKTLIDHVATALFLAFIMCQCSRSIVDTFAVFARVFDIWIYWSAVVALLFTFRKCVFAIFILNTFTVFAFVKS